MYSPKFIVENLKNLNNKTGKLESCHSETAKLNLITYDEGMSKYSLQTSIECNIKCESKSAYTKKISAIYNPVSDGLKPGNGYSEKYTMLGSYGVSLSSWATRACMEEAAKECKSLSKVEETDFIDLSSGQWSMKQKLSCESKDFIYSPFDAKVGAILAPNQSMTSPLYRNIVPQYKKPGKNISIPNSDDISKTCKYKIIGKTCFGDCVAEDPSDHKNWRLTLQTNEAYGDSEEIICGDEFLVFLQKQNAKPQVAQKLCEEFFWMTLRDGGEFIGFTCAAVRGSVDCSQLLSAAYQ